jgi:hypothetical protein
MSKKHLLNTNKDRFIFYYFIGDINLLEDYKVDEENKIVYLKKFPITMSHSQKKHIINEVY